MARPAALGPADGDAEARPRSSRLLEAVREVLSEALAAGGTSFDALYVNVNGESGYFDRSLQRLRPGRRAVRPLRHPDPPRRVHEPLVLQLPALPAASVAARTVAAKST